MPMARARTDGSNNVSTATMASSTSAPEIRYLSNQSLPTESNKMSIAGKNGSTTSTMFGVTGTVTSESPGTIFGKISVGFGIVLGVLIF
jgi:ABC-type polysaccharide/polyol phosphate transport system ATPase subunit